MGKDTVETVNEHKREKGQFIEAYDRYKSITLSLEEHFIGHQKIKELN